MQKIMYKKEDVASLIESGKKLYVAGDESILKELPKGNWIGGTIPYFMAEDGGKMTCDEVCVTEIPDDSVVDSKIAMYDEKDIHNVYNDAYNHGFSLILIPAMSPVHMKFSIDAARFESFAKVPLVGWITGVKVDDIGKATAKTIDGKTGEVFEDKALVLHCKLAEGKYANVGIVNIFEQGDGDVITFDHSAWETKKAFVNGEEVDFADYIKKNGLDVRLPLVADYTGARINVSFQAVNEDTGAVSFYAPFFAGVEYRQAKKVDDYVDRFTKHMPSDKAENLYFSCNCILNYLYSDLEGRQTGNVVGPITFGEVVYQLLNQTLAYISIENE